MNNTGDIIKERRKEKGISVQKLSELSGLARSTIYRLENGEIQNLNLKNATKILEPLDLSIDELIDEDDLENIEDKAYYKQIELDEKICFHANMRAYLHGCAISILHDDIFNPEFQTKYDKVLTFPSFNVRVQDKKILQYTQEKVGAALNNTLYENSFILRAVDFLAEN